MLKIRTIILSAVLALLLVLTAQLVNARTEATSSSSSDAASLSEIQEQPVDLNKIYSVPYYRSQFGECSDVGIRELAACLNPSQADQSPVDECFDVSISELAVCRNSGQKSSRLSE